MSDSFEVIAPDRQKRIEEIKAGFGQFVDQRIAEALALQDDAVFQPFFQPKKVSDELRRLQTVPEHSIWRLHYERYGCLDCKTRTESHAACGMCEKCHHRTYSHLKTLRRRVGRDRERVEDIIEQERLAYLAFHVQPPAATPSKLLPAPPDSSVGESNHRKRTVPHWTADVGARVRQLRKLAGLTQSELATAIGVDRKTIERFERGHHHLYPKHYAAAKQILGEAIVRTYWPD